MEVGFKSGEFVKPCKSDAPQLEKGVHLNLGCGDKLWEGFVNIDMGENWSGKRPDVSCDLRKLELPDDYADSAWAIHVLEHFQRFQTEEILYEWVRVLKPGGRLVIEVPCLDKVIMHFMKAFEEKRPINNQKTIFRLYGDPKYKDENMVHKWCFSALELKTLMENAGLNNVEVLTPEYHVPSADMRVTGTK